jgi:hypothetical protein
VTMLLENDAQPDKKSIEPQRHDRKKFLWDREKRNTFRVANFI